MVRAVNRGSITLLIEAALVISRGPLKNDGSNNVVLLLSTTLGNRTVDQ